jgi:hypothetical protein
MLLKITLSLTLFVSSLSYAAGGKRPPIVKEPGLELYGTGVSTGCSAAEYERANPRTRSQIEAVRADPTPYVEYMVYLLPQTSQILRLSNDQSSLVLTAGFRMARCDEVEDNVYQSHYFAPHKLDAVVAFPAAALRLNNYTAQATYMSQTASLRVRGLVQLTMPLENVFSARELETLNSGEAVEGKLFAFHALSRSSERHLNPFQKNRWIYSMDRERMPSNRYLRKIIPHLVIHYKVQKNTQGFLEIKNIQLNTSN